MQGWAIALLVALAGGVGSLARYGVGLAVAKCLPFASIAGLGWATLLVNVSGCVAIGLAAVALPVLGSPWGWLRPVVLTGLLGGWTTFSALGLETVQLGHSAGWGAAFAWVSVQVLLGIAGVAFGLWLGERLVTQSWPIRLY
jgi:CrcB protein